MIKHLTILVFLATCSGLISCSPESKKVDESEAILSAADILGNPAYPAISYGGYRMNSRDEQPTIAQLKEDMVILHAMGIRIFRTYNVHLPHAANVLTAISELRDEQPGFEMYMMLGAWIDCKEAWTANPDHENESERNPIEIARTVELANMYPEIVKVIAVGNESMVKWATSYFVQPGVILKWVNHLQQLKRSGGLPKEIWITSSDDFSSWGGASPEYHVEDLNKLIEAVDYISMHTYPMHNTHYNPQFWGVSAAEDTLPKEQKIKLAMDRSLEFGISQYDSVKSYMLSIGANKPIHIGETGWASNSDGFYGAEGSKATDEYKEGLYYQSIRKWSQENNISCFYFEAFDEPWKDANNTLGAENHFGIFTKEGRAKYAIWDLVDSRKFEGLTRDGNPIIKTFEGAYEKVFDSSFDPPINIDLK
ncbi:MAG: glycosyl hydrolase family 17 [Cyclobacteriaceae bacterium]